jgi:hypothetical protein
MRITSWGVRCSLPTQKGQDGSVGGMSLAYCLEMSCLVCFGLCLCVWFECMQVSRNASTYDTGDYFSHTNDMVLYINMRVDMTKSFVFRVRPLLQAALRPALLNRLPICASRIVCACFLR